MAVAEAVMPALVAFTSLKGLDNVSNWKLQPFILIYLQNYFGFLTLQLGSVLTPFLFIFALLYR